MRVLIIYAHPETEGHCSYILSKVREELEARKLAYELVDLYQSGYDPILSRDEHYTAGHYEISAGNQELQKKIKEGDRFIFIYPVWWGSMPAVLKGFFDRVLTPRFAYHYEGLWPKKLLKGKYASVIMTSGSPRIYFWLTGNRPKRLIKRDILGFCGINSTVFQIGNCHKFTNQKKEKLARIAKKAVDKLF